MTIRESREVSLESLVRQQEVLREVIESISGELDLRRLLADIVRHACDLLGADRGSVGLADTRRGVMRTEAVFCMPPGELGLEMPPGVGLAGRILESGQCVVLERYDDLDEPVLSGVDDDSVVGVPIEWRGEVIGFLGIGAEAPHRFSRADVDLLILFARHAAIAIANAKLVEDERLRSSRIEAIGRVSRLVTGSLSLDEILRTAVESVVESLGFYSAGLFLPAPGDPKTLVLLDRQGDPVDIEVGSYSQQIDEGFIGIAARERRAILVPDVHSDPRYVAFPGEATSRVVSEIAQPIVLGERLLGVLNVEAEHPLGDEDVAGLEIVADQLAIAIETARLFDERRELAALEERHRLAGELHDSVNQLLFSQSLIAQSVASAWRKDPSEGERRIERLLELVESTQSEMRVLLNELRPRGEAPSSTAASRGETSRGSLPDAARVEREGLVDALRWYCQRVAESGVEVALDVESYELQPIDREVAFFRIAQEALHNVVKHAGVERVDLRLQTNSEGCRMQIRDHGCGFELGEVGAPPRGERSTRTPIGLSSMRRRAEGLHGTLHIESARGAGTQLELVVPSVARANQR